MYYGKAIHQQPAVAAAFAAASLPNAEKHAATALALPIYPHMRDDEVEFVAEALIGVASRL